jgi:hypothetical protein
MHDFAAGKTEAGEKTKPRGLSIVRGGSDVAGCIVATAQRDLHLCGAPGSSIDNRRMVSSSLPLADGNDGWPMISTECSAWRGRGRTRRISGSPPSLPPG